MISTWGGDWGYHHLRKHPNIVKLLGCNSPTDYRGMTRDDHPNVSDQLYANYAIGQVEGIMARFHEIYVQDYIIYYVWLCNVLYEYVRIAQVTHDVLLICFMYGCIMKQ